MGSFGFFISSTILPILVFHLLSQVVKGDDIISTVAGTGTAGYSGDGAAATSAQLDNIGALDIDSSGNLYITAGSRIRRITSSTGTISTIAGTGTPGYSGDGGAATSAQLDSPVALTVDSSGNVFLADEAFSNNRVRKITGSTGVISTVAGTGSTGYSGDGGSALSADINAPYGLTTDSSGNLYIADTGNHRLRMVAVSTGVISTIAGTGSAGYSGDGSAATSAKLNGPAGIAMDTSGNFYISDANNHRIRKITASNGVISTIAGTGGTGWGNGGYSGDAGPATSAQLNNPQAVALDSAGNVYISDSFNHRIRKITVSTGTISTVAGTGASGYSGDGGAATLAQLDRPLGLALDSSGNLYFVDSRNSRIRKVDAAVLTASPSAGLKSPTKPVKAYQTTTGDALGSSMKYVIPLMFAFVIFFEA